MIGIVRRLTFQVNGLLCSRTHIVRLHMAACMGFNFLTRRAAEYNSMLPLCYSTPDLWNDKLVAL